MQTILMSFKKRQNIGLNGWMVEFFIGFYELLEKDLLKVVEEVKSSRKVSSSLNATFIALILKKNKPKHKIISKVLEVRVKKTLDVMSQERFWFLADRKIYEIMGATQEGIHSIKVKILLVALLKLDLSKAYHWS
jgi:hypothetical protein